MDVERCGRVQRVQELESAADEPRGDEISMLSPEFNAVPGIQNRSSTIARRFASNSYNIYLVHLPIVVAFQLLLARWQGPAVVKFVIVAVGSVLLSYGISRHVIKKSRLLAAIGLVAVFALMSILIRPR